MPLNSAGNSFAPLEPWPIKDPTVHEGTPYNGLTTAQCAANSNLTSKSVTSSGVLVDAGKVRTTGINLIVPTDQPQVTFGNDSPVAASISPTPIVAILPVNTFGQQVATAAGPPSPNGFAIPPGGSIFVANFNDPVYAITPSGVTATIYYYDT